MGRRVGEGMGGRPRVPSDHPDSVRRKSTFWSWLRVGRAGQIWMEKAIPMVGVEDGRWASHRS